MTLIQPVRLPERIKPLIDLKTKDEHITRSVVIRQLIYDGLEDYALELCYKGRISIGKAAELLERSIYDLQEMARERGMILSADESAAEESEKTAREIVKKLRVAK